MKTYRVAVTETTTMYYDIPAIDEADLKIILEQLESGERNADEIGEFADGNDHTDQSNWRLV